eukprot:TRINITY_DN32982_c0_g1_i1.p1 TRINITY_DN32982_c0_g1~~TRINITY_DN32982_c0_g1_i1.p1  ORF type:complete len:436 (+),score=130.12 TRINITY_DN32982_c0_g1_i1:52-1359(+)
MQAHATTTEDAVSVHASHYSDQGNLLELSHTLDTLGAQFKRCSLDAVRLELQRLSAQHAQEMEELEDRMEGEKRELSRQRDECRQYWYHNKEINEAQWRSLVHRAEHYAMMAPARGMHSVWRMSPELMKKAQDTPLYQMMLKRTVVQAWRTWAQSARAAGNVEKYINRTSDRTAVRDAFSAWRNVALKDAWARKDSVFKQQVQTDVEQIINDKDTEIAGLRQKLAETEQRLEAETRHRGALEERLKIAFMRGVCALNLEAMNVMKGEDGLAMSEATPSTADPTTISPATVSATPIRPPSEDLTALLHYDPSAMPMPMALSTLPQYPPVVEHQSAAPSQPAAAPKAPTVTPITRSSPHVICATAPVATATRATAAAARPEARAQPARQTTIVRTNPPQARRAPLPGAVVAGSSAARQGNLSAVLTVKEMAPSRRGQ